MYTAKTFLLILVMIFCLTIVLQVAGQLIDNARSSDNSNSNVMLLKPKKDVQIECDTTEPNYICHIYFPGTIYAADEYVKIGRLITNLPEESTVYLHLVGSGGSGEGAIYLDNIFKSGKLNIIANVDGPIASAHVLIALSADKMVISDNGYFYFHLMSGTNMVDELCGKLSGKDRGQSLKEKCVENQTKIVEIYNKWALNLVKTVLTKEEIKRIKDGYEVILPNNEIKRRLQM